MSERLLRNEWDRAFASGLEVARQAVVNICGHTKYEGSRPCPHDDAVAAIDALSANTDKIGISENPDV